MRRIGLFKGGLGNSVLISWLVVLSGLLLASCVAYTQEVGFEVREDNPMDEVSYLDQWGVWVDVQPFGMVWEPSVNPDWRPFFYGHWVWTDDGWAWVSYEPYGWLVYHYGNWDYQPDIGWFWIEGDEWSPARVQWITYDNYCSWAPLPPPGVTWEEPWHEEGLRFWVVVRDRDLDEENIGHLQVSRPPAPREMEGREVVRRAPDIQHFEKVSGRVVKPEPLKSAPGPIYRRTTPPGVEHQPQPGMEHGQQPGPQAKPPENRPAEPGKFQFHRMVLPENEQARVKKYSPQVERKVIVPKNKNQQPPHKNTKPEDRK